MAIYYMGTKTFGRANGHRGSVSTSAAAYRAGERIRDERTGAVYDHSRRADVLHKEILLPSRFDASDSRLDWARDRGQLWNAAEQAEHQRNSRVAREYVLALPHELNPEQRIVLAHSFAREVADRYGNGVDLAVHAPKTDPRNFHAHLLATTREITPMGLGAKTSLEWNGTRRHEQGLPRYREEQQAMRGRWVEMANGALRDAGLSERISMTREPGAEPSSKVWLPRIAWEIEKRGEHSYLGDLTRRQHAQRTQLSARQQPERGPEQRSEPRPEQRPERESAQVRRAEPAPGHEPGRGLAAPDPVTAWREQRTGREPLSQGDTVRAWREQRAEQEPSSRSDTVRAWREQRAEREPVSRGDAVQAWREQRAGQGIERGQMEQGMRGQREVASDAVRAWREMRQRERDGLSHSVERGARREHEHEHGADDHGL